MDRCVPQQQWIKLYRSPTALVPPLHIQGHGQHPPLCMVDDELTIAECGPDATLTNVVINNFTESKKLRFGIKNYNKMHIGTSTLD